MHLEKKRAVLGAALERFLREGEDSVSLLRSLADGVRPRDYRDSETAARNFRLLTDLLENDERYRQAVRDRMLDLLGNRAQVKLFSDAGILPDRGFFSEFWRRVEQRVLPELINPGELTDCLALIYHRRGDYVWFSEIPMEARLRFWQALDFKGVPDRGELRRTLEAITEALRVLAVRAAAMGSSPELERVYPGISRYESPFLALAGETERFAARFRKELSDRPFEGREDGRHLLVLVEQCNEVLRRARATALRTGTSLSLTYLLVRLWQTLRRLDFLVRALGSAFQTDREPVLIEAWVTFMREAVRGVIRRDSIREHFNELIGMLALRVTDNAGRTGEHYITASPAEYAQMWRSAGGAGLVIAVMALLKIFLSKLVVPPLNQAFLLSMNYSLGFMLIHRLHFTIATKQPAMTAATIAASISQARGHLRELPRVVDLVAQTVRSQLAAILGNVLVALPTAMAVGAGLSYLTGGQPVSADKAHHLLADLDPVRSLAVPHAAIAGVYLFLAGLISGYFDNLAAFRRIPERVAALPRLRRLIGPGRAEGLAGYIDRNLGGLAGNFFFGIFLGSTGTIGYLFGLPLDIRHIAFAAANFGYALVALDFAVPVSTLLRTSLGVTLIGLTNLSVSFALALWVALRSRGVEFPHGRQLLGLLGRRLIERPGEFLLPSRGAGENRA